MSEDAEDGYFDYEGRHVAVRRFDSNYGPGIGFECPECGTWGIILKEDRPFTIDKGLVTVKGRVACRRSKCDLVLRIEGGVGTAVDSESVSRETSGGAEDTVQ